MGTSCHFINVKVIRINANLALENPNYVKWDISVE